MTPEEAKDFGLIDDVVTRHDLPESDENGEGSGKGTSSEKASDGGGAGDSAAKPSTTKKTATTAGA